MRKVRPERTGWRDEGLSNRHRGWGFDCPALDIDFLLIEYSERKARALVEYKNQHAKKQRASQASYQALIDLGNRAGLPVFACRYADDFTWFLAVPLNDLAKQYVPERVIMTETEWVQTLYKIRGHDVPQSVLDGIHTEI